jgi:hypothetical protein
MCSILHPTTPPHLPPQEVPFDFAVSFQERRQLEAGGSAIRKKEQR